MKKLHVIAGTLSLLIGLTGVQVNAQETSLDKSVEYEKLRESLYSHKVGIGTGIALMGLGSTSLIIGFIVSANSGPCDDYTEGSTEYYECNEDTSGLGSMYDGLGPLIVVSSISTAVIISGIVLTTVAAVRYNRAKKVLKLLDEEKTAVSLKSFGAMPIPGGGAFGASFTF